MDARSGVLQHLSTPGADSRFAYLPAAVRSATGRREHEVWEAVWGLVADGLLYLDPEGPGTGTDNWRCKLSAAGIRVISGGPWEPSDPEGYLRRLRRQVPTLDPLAERYVEEALRAFNARCYLATSVMLGVASEQVFNRLAAAFVGSGLAGDKLARLIDDPAKTYFARFQELRKRLEPIRDDLPENLGEVLTLDAVGELLRVTRNAAGHPSEQLLDEETARTHLQMAVLYLTKMIAVAEHFSAHEQPP